MAKFGSKALLFINIAANQIRSAVADGVTAALHQASQTDIYDTIIPDNNTVADKATLNALVLGAGFKEGDVYTVTKDTDGTQAIYAYLRNRITSNYSWIRINYKTPNKLVTTSETTLANYILNDWHDGDLAIWDIVKISDICYLLKENNGSITGDYQSINLSGSTRYIVATITARNLLSPSPGDSCKVTDEDSGETANYDWKYDNLTSVNAWCCTGKWSEISIT